MSNLEEIVIQAYLALLGPKFYLEQHSKNPPKLELGKSIYSY